LHSEGKAAKRDQGEKTTRRWQVPI
jgi:hypothetical protein